MHKHYFVQIKMFIIHICKLVFLVPDLFKYFGNTIKNLSIHETVNVKLTGVKQSFFKSVKLKIRKIENNECL